jgi:hypothetical protein
MVISTMPKRNRPIGVAILVVSEITATALFGKLDLFSSPGRVFTFITQGAPGEQRMRPSIVAGTSEGFLVANGIPVQPDYVPVHLPSARHCVCIPDCLVDPPAAWRGSMGLKPSG